MKHTCLFAILTAASLTSMARAEGPGPGPDGDRPPGPPLPSRSNDGPRDHDGRGPGPDGQNQNGNQNQNQNHRGHGPGHRGDQQRQAGSEDKREHIQEALKHLRAAGLDHLAQRIEQNMQSQSPGQGRGDHRGPRHGSRQDGPRFGGPAKDNSGPGSGPRQARPPELGAARKFQHPGLPWGEGAFGKRFSSPSISPFARPERRDGPGFGRGQGQGQGRGPGDGAFGQRGPRPGPPSIAAGGNNLQEQLQKLQREVEQLRQAINRRGPGGPDQNDRRGPGAGPDQNDRRGPGGPDHRDRPDRDDSRKEDRRHDGPEGPGSNDERR